MGKDKRAFKYLPASLLALLLTIQSCTPRKDLPRKVIVVHARGISYPDLVSYLDTSKADSFLEKKEVGGFIYPLHPISNAVTICNLASFETGVLPAEHGIVGHSFGLREDGSIQAVSGFARDFGVETFWEGADKQGKKVLNIGALVLHGNDESHAHVDCLAQGRKVSEDMLLQLTSNKTATDSVDEYVMLESDNSHLLQIGGDSIVTYLDASKTDRQRLILDRDSVYENGFLGELGKGDWLEVENAPINGLTEAFRIKWLPTSHDTLHLYVRATYRNRGYPVHFLEQIEIEVGPSKGWPNISLYTAGQIDDVTLWEEMKMELNYVMEVFFSAVQRKRYDLIMIDYPLMDRLGHAFLQFRKSSQTIQQYYQAGFDQMNKDFRAIENFANQNGYDLIITSGHGFSPVHTAIDINHFLMKKGIHVKQEESDWEAIGIPGKVSAHIYINTQLSPSSRKNVLDKIESILLDLSLAEKPVIDEMYRKDALNKVGLNHAHSGDLYVLLNPGFVFKTLDERQVYGKPIFNGDHGYSPKYEDSQGILISNEPCSPCHSTDLAKIIRRKLDINR
ncbi:MAG: alkaline phosphatase family protein [Cyclobacteriaceae bacterium]|nr:alkaline phosphatase family protein [Cyclobacteriaceae bacterium HetDA_MAG_MS6]